MHEPGNSEIQIPQELTPQQAFLKQCFEDISIPPAEQTKIKKPRQVGKEYVASIPQEQIEQKLELLDISNRDILEYCSEHAKSGEKLEMRKKMYEALDSAKRKVQYDAMKAYVDKKDEEFRLDDSALHNKDGALLNNGAALTSRKANLYRMIDHAGKEKPAFVELMQKELQGTIDEEIQVLDTEIVKRIEQVTSPKPHPFSEKLQEAKAASPKRLEEQVTDTLVENEKPQFHEHRVPLHPLLERLKLHRSTISRHQEQQIKNEPKPVISEIPPYGAIEPELSQQQMHEIKRVMDEYSPPGEYKSDTLRRLEAEPRDVFEKRLAQLEAEWAKEDADYQNQHSQNIAQQVGPNVEENNPSWRDKFRTYVNKSPFLRTQKRLILTVTTPFLVMGALSGVQKTVDFYKDITDINLSDIDSVNQLTEEDLAHLDIGGLETEQIDGFEQVNSEPDLLIPTPLVEKPNKSEVSPVIIEPNPTSTPTLIHIDSTITPTIIDSSPTPKPTETPSTDVPPQQEAQRNIIENSDFLRAFYEKISEKRAERASQDPEFARRIDQTLPESINFGFIGYDVAQDGISRADAIIIATIDVRSGKIHTVRIPRDLHAPEVAGLSENFKDGAFRINGMTVFGDNIETRMVLEDATGLPVDAMLFMNFDGFKNIVDAIGGIDIEISENFYNMYGNHTPDPYDHRPDDLVVQQGWMHLRGQDALFYSRVRADTDYARGDRQQEVLRAVVKKILSTLQNDPVAGVNMLSNLRSIEKDDDNVTMLLGGLNPIDIFTLASQAASDTETLEQLTNSGFTTIDPWPTILVSGQFIRDKYQTSLQLHENINSSDPIGYWQPLREKIAEALHTSRNEYDTLINQSQVASPEHP